MPPSRMWWRLLAGESATMRSVCWCALAALAATLVLHEMARAADLPAAQPARAAPPSPTGCASFHEFVATECPLTWNGITVYGVYDVGIGWVSHGLPENAYNYEGESLVNRNGNHSQWLVEPTNLQPSGLGVRCKE